MQLVVLPGGRTHAVAAQRDFAPRRGHSGVRGAYLHQAYLLRLLPTRLLIQIRNLPVKQKKEPDTSKAASEFTISQQSQAAPDQVGT